MRDGSMLRRSRVETVCGEPVLATVVLAADGADIGKVETPSRGLGLGNAIEVVDSRAQVTRRAKRSGTG
jgi:hypothetical protein